MKLIENDIQEAYKSGQAKQCKECGEIKLLKDFPLALREQVARILANIAPTTTQRSDVD